jgi:hypothetical protein
MPSKDTAGSNATETSDWSSIWEAVSRLAATQESFGGIERLPSIRDSATPLIRTTSAGPGQTTDMDHEHLAEAMAEIEKASALLRRSEPALEVGQPGLPAAADGRAYWSVWLLIATIWISATLVVASAAAAIIYVLG